MPLAETSQPSAADDGDAGSTSASDTVLAHEMDAALDGAVHAQVVVERPLPLPPLNGGALCSSAQSNVGRGMQSVFSTRWHFYLYAVHTHYSVLPCSLSKFVC